MGGGGGGPTQQTITQSNIPDWLRPQVEQVLGGAGEQLFNYEKVPGTATTTPQYDWEGNQIGSTTTPGEDSYKITGVKPFNPFQMTQPQYDVAKSAIAGFSPLQQQAIQGAANLQVPGSIGAGTNLAATAGLGGLYAGQQYANMATDPGSMQAFMSPYMQNVVNVQQQAAQRQADIDRQAQQAQFARAGAFGGGRFGIQQSQAAADLARQKQTIQATGLQNAFQQAQQAQQFASTQGLQGLSTALSAAGQLGALGGQELAAQRGIIDEQTKAGALQQQQEQNIINQAINNYAQAQQYPLQQFNAFNALLRGYAIPGQTATTYQAPPSTLNQLVGLGTAAYGATKVFGNKEGGPVKMATGGVASLNARVLEDPYEFSPEQIKSGVKNGLISDLIGIPALSQIQQFRQQAQAMQAAQAAQQQQQPLAQALLEDQPQGIPALPTNMPTEGYAGGGILAFQKGGNKGLGDDEDWDAHKKERRRQFEQDLNENGTPEQRLLYKVSSAYGIQNPRLLVNGFHGSDPAQQQKLLNRIKSDPRFAMYVEQYNKEKADESTGVASIPVTREERIRQIQQDRANIAKPFAATADVLGLPFTAGAKAIDWYTGMTAEMANRLGLDRLARTVRGDPDFKGFEGTTLYGGSMTPNMDRVRNRLEELDNPQQVSESRSLAPAAAPAAASGDSGATGATALAAAPATVASYYDLSPWTDVKPASSPKDYPSGVDYGLTSRDLYTPGPLPVAASFTPTSQEAILAKMEETRKARLAEDEKANQPFYDLFRESLSKQEDRLKGADERNKALALIGAGLRMAQHVGPIGSAIGAGGIEGLSSYMRGDAANRAAQEKIEDARRAYAAQRLALEKGDRRAAEQAAQDVQKLMVEADRFKQLSNQQQNTYALQRYQALESGRQAAGTQRLGLAGLNVREKAAQAALGRQATERARIKANAFIQAGRQIAEQFKNDPVLAANTTPEQKQQMVRDLAEEIAGFSLTGLVQDLREVEED